ncbi:hypothetical protein QFZ29_002666 [Agromyces albus]|nr:hypothetical protein [Agromyces albus]
MTKDSLRVAMIGTAFMLDVQRVLASVEASASDRSRATPVERHHA